MLEITDEPIAASTPAEPFQADLSRKQLRSEYRIVSGDTIGMSFHVASTASSSEFRLAPGNDVTIKFVGLPELTDTQTVRPDGRISLPYLEDLPVKGKTVNEVTAELRALYKDRIANAEPFLSVSNFNPEIEALKVELRAQGATSGLRGSTKVRYDGNATFYMIGDVACAGKTVNQLRAELNRRYQSIAKGLKCDPYVLEAAGDNIYILGQVNDPGAYPIGNGLTLLQALAVAGSPTTEARLSEVVIARQNPDQTTMSALRFDLTTVTDGTNIAIRHLSPEDVIYVPRRGMAAASERALELGNLILFRGWRVGSIGE